MRVIIFKFIFPFLFSIFLSQGSYAQLPVKWNSLSGGSLTNNGNSDEGRSVKQTPDGGYVMAGITNSADMDVSGSTLYGGNDIWVVKTNASAGIEWQKVFGGSANEICNAVINTPDGGFLITGATFSNDGLVTQNKGRSDIWVIKLTSTGNLQWQKTFGGSFEDEATAAVITGDGGYMITGYTFSNNGDVTANKGIADLWVLKLDATGNLVWQRNYGGNNIDQGNAIAATNDGAFVIAGFTNSNNGDVVGKKGGQDVWILKINATGTLIWQKPLGGNSNEYASAITTSQDGSLYFAGGTTSNDGDVSGNRGGLDMWVVKLTDAGSLTWQKCLGGSLSESANGIAVFTDGSVTAGGYTNSNNGDVSGNAGQTDFWAVKLSSTGVLSWQNTLGGSAGELCFSAAPTTDNATVFIGRTNSANGDVTGLKGGNDFWLVKLSNSNTLAFQKTYGGAGSRAFNSFNKIISSPDKGSLSAGSTNSYAFPDYHGKEDFFITKVDSSGNVKWQKCFGGSENDVATSIVSTKDSGYLIAGYSSSEDGDIFSPIGLSDGWIVKIDSAGNYQWSVNVGGTDDDFLFAITPTKDGHFVAAGYTSSTDGDATDNHGFNDYWVLKITETGSVVWSRCFGSLETDEAYDVEPTNDSGVVVTGGTLSEGGMVTSNNGSYDIWVVKISSNGNLQWQKSFGGTNNDVGREIKVTADTGFIITGYSSSKDFDFTVNKGGRDLFVLKTDQTGSLQWQKTFGGLNDEEGADLVVNSDNEYLISGITNSTANDVSNFRGVRDLWLLNLRNNGSLKWQRTFGGSLSEVSTSLSLSSRGNYLLSGNSVSADGDLQGINPALTSREKAWALELGNCPYPTLNSNGPLELCSGTTFALTTDSLANYSYQWLKDGQLVSGATFNSFNVSQPGSYAVRVVNGLGCAIVSPSVTVNVKPSPPLPAITPAGSANGCIGDGLVINTNPQADVFYDWRKNGTSILGLSNQNSLFVTSNGNYSLILQSKSTNCRSTESTPVAVNFFPRPLKPTITVNASQLISSSVTGNQWYLNDVAIPGATQQFFSPASSGEYTLTVASNGCSSDPADPVNYVITSTTDFISGFQLKVYPVPVASGQSLVVSWNRAFAGPAPFKALFFDVNGKQVGEKLLLQNNSTVPVNYARGIYLMKMISRDGKTLSISKILVQ